MNQTKLQQYAEMIVKVGLRVEKGEEIWIGANMDVPEFVATVVEECYKAGAKKVRVDWLNDDLDRLNYKYMSLGELSKVPNFKISELKYQAKKLPSRLWLIGEDPDALKGININKMTKAKMKVYSKIKPYRDLMESKHKWVIAGIPGYKWAQKVFPKCSKEDAMERLWDAILVTSRVDETNTVQNWVKHNAYLENKKQMMEKYNFQYLVYKSSLGTDFKVELNPLLHWGAGCEQTNDKRTFNPNIPTEEVFTTPIKGRCEGKLVASLPLSYNGNLIQDFSITFKDGKVSEVYAKKGQKLLEQMVKMDENACYLGEVALVPFTSPINQTGILFYNTLYDENAVCHFALGMGFKELLPGGAEMSPKEAMDKGVNDSMIHVDFMVGTKDLSIVGITHDGKKIQVFKDGVWAI